MINTKTALAILEGVLIDSVVIDEKGIFFYKKNSKKETVVTLEDFSKKSKKHSAKGINNAILENLNTLTIGEHYEIKNQDWQGSSSITGSIWAFGKKHNKKFANIAVWGGIKSTRIA